MDEQLLIAGCKRGESWARKQLYEIHAPVMMSVCMRYVNNRETAKDLLQDGFIKIFTRIDSFSGTGSLGGWIRKIFVTTALEYLRQNKALKLNIHIEDCNDGIEYINTSAIDRLSADELLDCISTLPDGFRTVFNLFAIEGYSHREIAEMLNIKESTSRSQFVRARKILQKNVESLIEHQNAGSKQNK